MNILVIVKLYFHKNRSGGEAYLHKFLKYFNDYLENVKISVLIPNSQILKQYEYEKIKIYEIPNNLNELDSYFDNCNLVITQLDISNKVVKLSLKHNKPVLWIFHGSWDGYKPLIYNNNPLITKIFNSNNVLNEFKSNIFNIENYFIINPMFDFEKFKKYKFNRDRREYITLVNPSENKGADIVLKLAKLNKNKKFLIVEGGYYLDQQKPYIDKFKKLANCHIISNTDDMINDVYLKSKIVLMPSKYESWGMVCTEASSFGIPVIISKTSLGLNEQMNPINLKGDKTIKSYNDKLKLLDHKETYHLWSELYYDVAEDNYLKNLNQIKMFFESYNFPDF